MLSLTACGRQEPPTPPEVTVATVNGERIGLKEYEKALGEEAALTRTEKPLKTQERESLKEEILGRLIEERVMLQRARELSLTVTEAEIEARIDEVKKDYGNEGFNALFVERGISYPEWKKDLRKRMLLEKVIAVDVNQRIQVTDAEAELYFKANRKAYAAESRVHAVQIVVRDRDVAEGLLKRLKAGEDFGKVAREVSISPEASSGGDLGFFERGVMPEDIERQVFSLPVGQMSRVIQSPYGFHIFKVLDRQEGGARKFAEARERVIADLKRIKEAEAYERWIEKLEAKAAVEIMRPLPEAAVPVEPGTGRDKPEAQTGER
jgi:parvulin-like peptidyl-prolyl isomerase